MIQTNAVNNGINIHFLGTGAADWAESLADLKNYSSTGGFRRYSSALINGHILIDCGLHVLDAFESFGLDPHKLTDILITHTHEDHLSPYTLKTLAGIRKSMPPLRLWAHKGGISRIPDLDGLEVHPLRVGRTLRIGNLNIKSLEANHIVDETKEKPLHYLFTCNDSQLLYATDGAWFLKPTWLELRKSKLDAVIFDATIGDIEGDRRIFDHNSLPMIRLMLKTFKNYGILKENANILLTHMARTLHPSHDEIVKNLSVEGITPAYDGLSIDI